MPRAGGSELLARPALDGERAAAAGADLEMIERGLRREVARLTGAGCPPRLAAALRLAVLAGGQRIRPRLCCSVARASSGLPPSALTELAALGVELLHCASLVHDDLPSFDDAPTRRGQPSVHCLLGEAAAVLCGDALIVAAFELLGEGSQRFPCRGAGLIRLLARAAGTPEGMSAPGLGAGTGGGAGALSRRQDRRALRGQRGHGGALGGR